MKKIAFVLCFLISIINIPFSCYAYENIDKILFISQPYKSPEQSREKLYQDIFISLLMPEIQKSVDDYYKEFFTDTPLVAPYDITILKAERPNGYRTFVFLLKIEIYPYIGAHNTVGIDHITIRTDGSGNVKVEKFEHIESSYLPSDYHNILKKKYGENTVLGS
ncbi:DUF3888 domain-containing protein [Clostridium scatologenes]|uniref:DUF3888 domain-containing protein n=1 Tax=Clostridium scatologenes TaxID=1548 RepID=A0A0E3JS18_CLOSL|nr:DUF3888 domain-containing protein [Clostridium scatologenes]AKA72042.1 hypothetical protein CSCA_4917 [Clostridium scatologenes]